MENRRYRTNYILFGTLLNFETPNEIRYCDMYKMTKQFE